MFTARVASEPGGPKCATAWKRWCAAPKLFYIHTLASTAPCRPPRAFRTFLGAQTEPRGRPTRSRACFVITGGGEGVDDIICWPNNKSEHDKVTLITWPKKHVSSPPGSQGGRVRPDICPAATDVAMGRKKSARAPPPSTPSNSENMPLANAEVSSSPMPPDQ
eukprot:2244902-Prymnesium_polylepis.1